MNSDETPNSSTPPQQTPEQGGRRYDTPLPSGELQPVPWLAIVQDRDSPARNFYQNTVSNGTCFGTCDLSFPVVPAGKRLIVQQVSIQVVFLNSTPQAGGPPAAILLRGANVFQSLPVTQPLAPFADGRYPYTAHAGVLAAYDSDQGPLITVLIAEALPSPPPYRTVASISGYMIDIP